MLEALIEVVRKSASGDQKKPNKKLVELAEGAPASVRELITCLATRTVSVDLGWRSIETRYAGSLADTADTIDDLEDEDDRLGELANSLQIGASAGGEVYFGVSWNDSTVSMVELDREDGFLTWFDSVEAFLERVRADEARKGDEIAEGVIAIYQAAGQTLEVAPRATTCEGLRGLKGRPPEHPHARAQAHFDQQQLVFAAGPTPAGQHVVVRRYFPGRPASAGAVTILAADGAATAVKWGKKTDTFGVCLVPDTERVLLCTGSPGPLLELDLETGKSTERLPKVRWSCGFLDPDHLAVLADDKVCVYRYSEADLGEPVASAAVDGFNIFVGHGLVFCKTKARTTTFHVLGWNGTELVDQGRHAVAASLFGLHAAVEAKGEKLVASIDTKGKAHWLVLS